MVKITKHIGFTNTGSVCVVVMPTIPNREDHALIVESDVLPPKFADSFADLVKTEGQNTTEPLANLLSRRRFPTSSRSMLEELHLNKFLKPFPIKQITMRINNGQTMPLEDIVNAMKGQKTEPAPAPAPVTDTPVDAALVTTVTDINPKDHAKNLMMQADLLLHDAEELKKKAIALDPDLQPKPRSRKQPPVKKDA